MSNKKFTVSLILIFVLAAMLKADMPPPPGYTKIARTLYFETKEDFSDYRFFLISRVQVIKEITFTKGEINEINGYGGGHMQSSCTLWAIPKKKLAAIDESLSNIQRALSEKSVKEHLK